ncbi:MAG: DUF4007 family protein [Verrucomicrobiae bacterium]|nr:DUF4007 family protein [Verrucomicrobiae bacterium]
MKYKFSGHETFAFRFAWLPKAYNAISEDPFAFSDEDQAIITLGVGKNMVRSIRFWALLSGVIEPDDKGGCCVSQFGRDVFCQEDGFDPYLENEQTLWLLHWQISTAEEPLFAWDFLLNRWQETELLMSVLLPNLQKSAEKEQKISKNSLGSLLKVFFHTYVPTRGQKSGVLEENLDCPLVQLRLVEQIGVRENLEGRNEAIYAFRRSEKPEICDELFFYALACFWMRYMSNEETISIREVSCSPGSPGQIFKLTDEDIRGRLSSLPTENRSSVFSYFETQTTQLIKREKELSSGFLSDLLKQIYQHEKK